MKHIETAKLREQILSKIDHNYGLPEIEAALDEYVDSVILNVKKESAAPEMLEALETLVAEEWAKDSNFEKYVVSLIKKARENKH